MGWTRERLVPIEGSEGAVEATELDGAAAPETSATAEALVVEASASGADGALSDGTTAAAAAGRARGALGGRP